MWPSAWVKPLALGAMLPIWSPGRTIVTTIYWALTMCQTLCYYFTCIIWISPQISLMRELLLSFPFYRWESKGPESFKPKVTQLVSGVDTTRVCVTPDSPCLPTERYCLLDAIQMGTDRWTEENIRFSPWLCHQLCGESCDLFQPQSPSPWTREWGCDPPQLLPWTLEVLWGKGVCA